MAKPSQHNPGDELEKAQEEAATYKAGWQRCQADFDNFRRRTEQERKELVGLIQVETLLELAPIHDNFARAFEHLKDVDVQWTAGFTQIARQLQETFTKHGLVRIATVGEPFDPNRHEALSQIENPAAAPDTVLQEIEAGFEYNGRVLKPAKVVVNSRKAEESNG